MNISSAIFDRSAPDLESCPDESLPEFAFIGRSNVGKSSLLNMLAGKQGLARVSDTPGFTKLINIFTMNKTWRLVDLPGYGFAHVARVDKSKFNMAVAEYLEHRVNLCCVFTLIDSGLSPQTMDLEFVEWLATNSVPFVLVFTKTDKITPPIAKANMEDFTNRISGWSVNLPEIFTCSAKTKQGRTELLAMIEGAVADYRAAELAAADAPPEPQAPDAADGSEELPAPILKPKVRAAAKKRHDLIRPW